MPLPRFCDQIEIPGTAKLSFRGRVTGRLLRFSFALSPAVAERVQVSVTGLRRICTRYGGRTACAFGAPRTIRRLSVVPGRAQLVRMPARFASVSLHAYAKRFRIGDARYGGPQLDVTLYSGARRWTQASDSQTAAL